MTFAYRLDARRLVTRGLAVLGLAAGLAAPTLAAADGKSLYMDNCSACHQVSGKGVKGAFPTLAGSPLVVGDAKVVAATVLNGRAGMPAFKDELSDADLSAILTYIRTSWGNTATPLAAKDVAAARGGAKTAARGLQAH